MSEEKIKRIRILRRNSIHVIGLPADFVQNVNL